MTGLTVHCRLDLKNDEGNDLYGRAAHEVAHPMQTMRKDFVSEQGFLVLDFRLVLTTVQQLPLPEAALRELLVPGCHHAQLQLVG